MKIKYSKSNFHNFDDSKNKSKLSNLNIFEKEVVSGKNTFSYLLYFLVIVFLCILISITVRAIFLYQKSTFNTGAYTVLINSKKPFIISYDKNLKQFSFVGITGPAINKTKMELLLGVPIDAQINAQNITKDNFNSTSLLLDQIFRQWKYSYQGMTLIDYLNLAFASYSIPKKDINSQELKLSKKNELSGMSQEELYNTFKDSQIVNEQKSIEIINDTYITGLAGTVGQIIKNTGGNVVSVKSGEIKKDTNVIVTSNSETATRITHLLGASQIVDSNMSSIADIQIVIGTDFGKKVGNM